MTLSIPKFIVRKGTTNYTTDPDNCSMDLKVNNPWEATMTFNNSSGNITGVFSCEDEVYLFINSASASNLVMVGFIDEIEDKMNPDREWVQTIHIIDWVSYYAAKTIYERDWHRSTITAADIISGSGGTVAEISGLSSFVLNLNTVNDKTPRKFNGTYVKDAWHTIAENVGADFTPSYSVNAGLTVYTKTINFFGHNTINLTESTTGLIFKIKDIVPVTADTLMVIHNSPYEFTQSARYRFTSVTAMTGQVESRPDLIDSWCTPAMSFGLHPVTGKEMSSIFLPFYSGANINAHWKNSASPTIDPFTYLSDETLCGAADTAFIRPTIKLNIRDNTTSAETFIAGRNNVTEVAPTYQNFGLFVTDWQKLGFVIKNGLTGATVNHIKLRLYDAPIGGNYWERDIYDDVIVSGGSRTSWTYVEYDLPANTTDSTSNGWTKVGSPTVIDHLYMRFENGAGLITGYTAASYIGFTSLHFYRRQRKTVTSSGVLTTEKIILDSSTKNPTALTTLATKELSRINKVGKSGRFTIAGNIEFNKPGFNINVDFTSTLGSGRSGSPVRISSIRHFLDKGRYFTYVEFEDAFQRI